MVLAPSQPNLRISRLEIRLAAAVRSSGLGQLGPGPFRSIILSGRGSQKRAAGLELEPAKFSGLWSGWRLCTAARSGPGKRLASQSSLHAIDQLYPIEWLSSKIDS